MRERKQLKQSRGKNIIGLFILLLSISHSGFAQITGKITDARSKKPIELVSVQSAKTGQIVLSDETGDFQLNNNYPDTLYFTHPAYLAITIVIGENQESLKISLEENPLVLGEVNISAFRSERNSMETAGSVSVVKLFNQESLEITPESLIEINALPGIQFEQRSQGSYRINIRGSSMRAPYDVRNVKVYWNGIPYTEPGGNTPFNLLEPSFFGHTEVIRGPSSSLYGAGNGGTILIDSKRENEKFVEYGFSTGSYGLLKHNFTSSIQSGSGTHTIRFSDVYSEGYRNHSELKRSTVEYNGSFLLDDKQTIEANLLFSDLIYEIPGGLNVSQYEKDPTQARPGNRWVMSSEEANASIDVENFLLGLNYNNEINKNIELTSSLYTVITDFENPFLFDYKREAQQGAGTRNAVTVKGNLGDVNLKTVAGFEYQNRFVSGRNYENNSGTAGALNFDDEIRTNQAVLFLQSEVKYENFTSTAGFSVNYLDYDIYRLSDADLDSSYRFERKFEPVFSPRITLLYDFGKVSAYGLAGFGFSPPTLEEVRTNEGSLNSDIVAENGLNIEIGIKAKPVLGLYAEMSAFYYQLQNTIVDYTDPRGTDLFRNSGSTKQKGIEMLAGYDFQTDIIPGLENSVTMSYTLHSFKFNEYVEVDEFEEKENDYSGNFMPGIAPNTFAATWQTSYKNGTNFSLFYLYKDGVYLNNINDVSSTEINLLNVKIGQTIELRKRAYQYNPNGTPEKADKLNLYFGINNLLDKQYSLGNDVNAFGGRYFQPALRRNFIAGISYKFEY